MRRWFAVLALGLVVLAAVIVVARVRSNPTQTVTTQTNDLAAREATGVAGLSAVADPATWASARFGHTVRYDPRVWQEGPVMNAPDSPSELVAFNSDGATLSIVALPAESGKTMVACVQDHLDLFLGFTNGEVVVPPSSGGASDRAWAIGAHSGAGFRKNYYMECRAANGVTLHIEHAAPDADYPRFAAARDALLAGIDTSRAAVPSATPVASPVGGDTAIATPVG